MVFFTETHTSRSAAGLKKICSWDCWCATHSNQSASTRAKKLSNKTDRKPTSTPFGYAFLLPVLVTHFSLSNSYYIHFMMIYSPTRGFEIGGFFGCRNAFGLCGIVPPNPTDQPGPMCLEGLEEASGESSSESLKKFGPSNLKL